MQNQHGCALRNSESKGGEGGGGLGVGGGGGGGASTSFIEVLLEHLNEAYR